MELVSIIMPFRNALPFLEECLKSIQGQSHINWELLAVNDHSTDESYHLISEFASTDPRIQCFQNSGKGIIDALNTGYAFAKGQFVTRMDADDIMPHAKLEALCGLLRLSGRGHLSTGKVKYIGEGQLGDGYKKYEEWLNQLCSKNMHYKEIYKECVIPSPCWMMYTEDFDSIGAFKSESYPEDYDLCFRMYENQIKITVSSDVLHIWRDHGGRSSRNDENYLDNRFLDLKVKYFLRNDYSEARGLVVWGAGKKGKQIARLLIEKNIEFDWVTNNPKKKGKDIYGKRVLGQNVMIDKDGQSIIIAVANKTEQDDITAFIQSLTNNHLIYKFC